MQTFLVTARDWWGPERPRACFPQTISQGSPGKTVSGDLLIGGAGHPNTALHCNALYPTTIHFADKNHLAVVIQ